ncbi:MAG TPA: RsbRD N-terminal domain-containing protein [Blastocatellia bacterium]|nr:RsbRD N-terminal domain-containing protein [Blastocatellia bacterium]
MAHADLAGWIERHKDKLTSRWIDAVRADVRIQSDADLSDEGLRNHIPAVIEEVCELLRSATPPTISNTQEARVHAYIRFRQGYRVRDLVREISLLRLLLLDHLAQSLFEESLNVATESFVTAMRLIDAYIDEEISYAVSVYTETMKPHE